MKEERKFQIIYIAWVPFVLGVLGYNIEHIPFWEAIYASAALYFVNPVLDNNNVLILLAKLTALLVSATIIIQVVKNVSALLKNKLRILMPGTVVIYTDTEQGTQLAKNISNGIVSHNGPEDSVENAKIHFIAFENDLDNLRFYSMNEERLKGCHVYIQSNQIEPSLLQSYSNTDVRFFNTAELIARYYWDNNELFNNILGDNHYRLAIIGFGPIGRAIFKKGFLNNIFSLDQQIEYHIWGVSELEKEFLDELKSANDDVVITHLKSSYPAIRELRLMDRIIFLDDNLELLQQLLLELPGIDIHFYSEEGMDIKKIVSSDRVKAFGDLNHVLHVDMIQNESFYRMGKLFNYDYYLRAHKKTIDIIEEDILEEEWNRLSGFLRESNLSRADHYGIEKYLRENEIDDETIKELEHIRWCRFHYYNHWKYGEKKDSALRVHPFLISYEELEKSEQNKDDFYCDLIRSEVNRLLEPKKH